MILKDFITQNKDLNLTRVKVKIPKDALSLMKKTTKYAQSTMWIAGVIMGEFMLSPDSPDEKKRRLVLLPESKEPSFLLNCEVVKILKK